MQELSCEDQVKTVNSPQAVQLKELCHEIQSN